MKNFDFPEILDYMEKVYSEYKLLLKVNEIFGIDYVMMDNCWIEANKNIQESMHYKASGTLTNLENKKHEF